VADTSDTDFLLALTGAYHELYVSCGDGPPPRPSPPADRNRRITRDTAREAELAGRIGQEVVDRVVAEAADKAARLSLFLKKYASHLSAIGVGKGQIREYLALDRRTLGSLYAAAREPVPSPDALRRLTLRLAVDVRQPIVGRLDRFVTRKSETGWEVGVYEPGPPLVLALPPPGGFRPVRHLYAELLLDYVPPQPVQADEIVNLIEQILGGKPTTADTLEARPARLTFYVDRDDRLWLQIDGNEVGGIEGNYEQALLKYLCHNPAVPIYGRELEKKVRNLKNAASAARKVREAMGRACREAGTWLQTNPLRWADSITPLDRATVRGSGR
jgi:hypothetical protein